MSDLKRVDQAAVVDGVAGDERPLLVVEESDAARRVTGEVDDAEASVAEGRLSPPVT